MATETLSSLRSAALTLTVSERADLADSLIRSLDGPDVDLGVEWEREIGRRVLEVESGEVQTVAATLVFEEVRRALAR